MYTYNNRRCVYMCMTLLLLNRAYVCQVCSYFILGSNNFKTFFVKLKTCCLYCKILSIKQLNLIEVMFFMLYSFKQ